MKNLFLLIASFFIIGTAFSQSYNVIPGKNEFTDTMKLRKLKNNAALEYIISTDTAGRLVKVIKNTPVVYHGVDSITTNGTGNLCVWTGGLPNCFQDFHVHRALGILFPLQHVLAEKS